MGLTIHYGLKANGSEKDARELVGRLHQEALDLPFASVGEVVEFEGAQADQSRCGHDHPHFNLLGGGRAWVRYDVRSSGSESSTYRSAIVYPTHLIAFEALPGEGCESARFGLCRYAAFAQVGPTRRIRTGLDGWCWQTFCKTQYASNPECGGVENFLRCHLCIVALLDRAKALGCGLEVSDEGGFWVKRSVPDLVREVGQWNENIAGLFGALQSVAGAGLEGEIQKFPNFEHLEAAGLAKPELQKLRRLLVETGAKFDAPRAPEP
jgi:hypothetical protein